VTSTFYRFAMIERNRSGDELRETFSVLGSTGNVGIDKTMIIRASLTWVHRCIPLSSIKCRGAIVRPSLPILNIYDIATRSGCFEGKSLQTYCVFFYHSSSSGSLTGLIVVCIPQGFVVPDFISRLT
jgi:hypothetical protein